MKFPNFHITDAGFWESPHSIDVTPTRLVTKYELECYVSNTGETCINGHWFELKKSSISFSKPGQFRFSKLPFQTKYIYFELEEDCPDFEEFLASLPTWSAPQKQFEEIFDEISAHKENELRSMAQLIGLLYLIKDTSAVKDSCESKLPGEKEIAEIVLYMKENLSQRLTVEKMAQKCGYSQPHFTHLFRKYLNASPYDYFIELKLAAAERMLLSGQSVAEISEQLGFNSTSHFCAIFQKKRGMTPRNFAKNNTYFNFTFY